MPRRTLGALVLVMLTACASTPRLPHKRNDSADAQWAVARYEVRVLTAGALDTSPVKISKKAFQQSMRQLAPAVHGSERPQDTAHWLLEQGLETHLLAEVEHGRVLRLVPLEEDSPLSAATAAKLNAEYQALCARRYGGGDCLKLYANGPSLIRDDRRTLALALALDSVLEETRESLKDMVSPREVLALLVTTAGLYMMMWLVPEPVSKAVAVLMTVGMMAWVGLSTLWDLMDGWAQLVHEADRATSYEELEAAGKRFREVLSEHAARALILMVTAALGGGAARLSQKLPKLPGFERAAAQMEAQGGVRLSAAGEVEAVAVPTERTFTLMLRRPGSSAAAAQTRVGVTIIIRHRGGNVQVLVNGQRWHVPAGRSLSEIPAHDPIGDQLQAAVLRISRKWSRNSLTEKEFKALQDARAQGRHLEAHLMERRFRGQWVERQLRREFENLRWNPKGVDAVDPTTGYRYEILSGTNSNMELHGRRMAEELFRMIIF